MEDLLANLSFLKTWFHGWLFPVFSTRVAVTTVVKKVCSYIGKYSGLSILQEGFNSPTDRM